MTKVYRDLFEAHSEIKRDLSKAPTVMGQRVQNKAVVTTQNELTNYSYSVLKIPVNVQALLAIADELGIWTEYPKDRMEHWLLNEARNRTETSFIANAQIPEFMNPALEAVKEGEESSYYYADRLFGMTEILSMTLGRDPFSRRAFFPMFSVEDAKRAPRLTRIPCTIGYHAFIRMVDDVPHLHLTYLQRSCDFRTFWLSDLYFASRIQQEIALNLEMKPGALTHTVLSLHAFLTGEEIY